MLLPETLWRLGKVLVDTLLLLSPLTHLTQHTETNAPMSRYPVAHLLASVATLISVHMLLGHALNPSSSTIPCSQAGVLTLTARLHFPLTGSALDPTSTHTHQPPAPPSLGWPVISPFLPSIKRDGVGPMLMTEFAGSALSSALMDGNELLIPILE